MDQETTDKIAKLRAVRDEINLAIEGMKHKARDVSVQIAAMEGPIADRLGREVALGYSIKPKA